MDTHTEATRRYLNKRFSNESRFTRKGDGLYLGHQPIYGFGGYSDHNHAIKLSRIVNILRFINGLEFQSCLDVGGGEGYLLKLLENLFGAKVLNSELSFEACSRADKLYGIQSICNDGSVLPFENKAFDLVICSEVIEHTVDPVMVISELDRVAKKYLLITTEQFCETEEERHQSIQSAPLWIPNAERNYFTIADFLDLLGHNIEVGRQFAADICNECPDSEKDLEKIKKLIKLSVERATQNRGNGIIILKKNEPQTEPQRKQYSTEELIEAVLAHKIDENAATPRRHSADDWPRSFRVTCTECRNILEKTSEGWFCNKCGSTFKSQDGIPILFPITGRLAEEKRSRLSRYYARYDEIFPRKDAVDPQERFHIHGLGKEWISSKDSSENEYYYTVSQRSTLTANARHGAAFIRLTCRTICEHYASVPLTIKADGMIHLATLPITRVWRTYTFPVPLAKQYFNISFVFGDNEQQFSQLRRTGDEASFRFELYSFETGDFSPSTLSSMWQKTNHESYLPTVERVKMLETKLELAESKIAHLEKLLPIRLYRKLRGRN